MFQFMAMAGNYASRKVARDDFDWGFISTAAVNDGTDPFETAVEHERYGKMVIVESYATKELAEEGHKKWVKTMTAKTLPEELVDCMHCELTQLMMAIKPEPIVRKRK